MKKKRTKEKTPHDHLNWCTKKAFDKIQNLFLIKKKSPYKLGIKRNTMKFKYENPMANIRLNNDRLKPASLKSGTKQECLLPSFLFYMVLEILAIAIR